MQAAETHLGRLLGPLAAIALACAGVHAAEVWLEPSVDGRVVTAGCLAAAAPDVAVHRYGDHGVDLSVTLHGVGLADVHTRGGAFVELTWPDAPYFGEIGAPALPVVRRLIVLPEGAAVDVSFETAEAIRVDLAARGFDDPVLPGQAPIEKLPGARERAPFDFNGAAYAINRFAPRPRVTIEECGVVRGNRLALLEVRPVAYNPVRHALLLWPQIDVGVRFTGGRAPASVGALPSLPGVMLNPPADPAPRGLNYLIVVAEAYAAAIDPFVAGKTAQGFDVMTYEVPAGTSATTIRNYIKSLWGTSDAPDYVLLVGDTDKIPRWDGQGDGSPDTDIYYACMDAGDDWYPDIAIGRFPVRSTGALQDVIDKTLFIEAGTYPNQDYVMRAVFMASEDNWQISEGTHNYVIDTHLDPLAFTCDKLYCHTYGATTQQVHDAFDNGRIYGVFSGHGSPDGWHDGPPFFRDDVQQLQNEGMYSCVYSFSCSTGDYHGTTECFTETFLLAADKGAASVYGSSVSSYWDEDDWLERYLFDVIYADDIREVSGAWQAAFLYYLDHYGPTGFTRRYFEMYNLMGDPSLYIPLPGGGADMFVTPVGSFTSEGPHGGPFTPESKTYVVKNNAEFPIEFSVVESVSWLELDVTGGVVPVGGTADVIASISDAAATLPNGHYEAPIEFINETTHDGDCSRTAILDVGVPVPVITFDMDTNPGWSMNGEWAFGKPTGQGGYSHGYPDPTSGATGQNVCGINLNGDYSDDQGPWAYLTTNAIDCSELFDVELHFQRWLNSDYQPFLIQSVEASNDGTNWQTVWSNGSGEIADNSWKQQAFDVSDIADFEETVYIRWGHKVDSSGAYAYSGWNIDDVEIWGVEPQAECPGDCTGDGVVDVLDLLAVLAAWGQTGALPEDVTGDGVVDVLDLLAVLGAWGPCP